MKLTGYFLAVVLIFINAAASGQNRNIYFLKNSGKEVQLKDSADFIRVVQEPDSGAMYYSVTEYFPDNKRKFIGQASSFEPLILEGQTISFYKNGKKKENITYEKGLPTGLAYYFDANGKPRKIVEFGKEGMEQFFGFGKVVRYKAISVFDSVGRETVISGTGTAYEDFGEAGVTEQGKYVNGVKEGLWKGYDSGNKVTFEELYESGKLLEGVSARPSGDKFKYIKNGELPKFKGGEQAFGLYLGRNIKYPADARERRITGRVIVQFVVEKDGSLSDIEVVRSVYPSLDNEALKVIRNSSKWISGTQRGVPVRVSFRVPIFFQLGG